MAMLLFRYVIRILEVLFFTGILGCLVVVVLSWISIFKSGFSPD
jgi:hypothetical protein